MSKSVDDLLGEASMHARVLSVNCRVLANSLDEFRRNPTVVSRQLQDVMVLVDAAHNAMRVSLLGLLQSPGVSTSPVAQND